MTVDFAIFKFKFESIEEFIQKQATQIKADREEKKATEM